jgi:hypothetical protein
MTDQVNTVSNSKLTRHFTCPGITYWTDVRGLESTAKAVDLDYGQVIHDMLAEYMKELRKQKPADQCKRIALDVLKEGYFNKQIEHQKKTLEAGAIFLTKVINLHLEDRGDIVSIEEKGSKPLPGGVNYEYIIDLSIQTPEGLLIVDYKTISIIGSSYFLHTLLDRQLRGYTWAVNAALSNKVMLHCVKDPEVYEHEQPYPEGEIDLWVEETDQTASRLCTWINRCKREPEAAHRIFPRAATMNCTQYMRQCKFFKLCSQGNYNDAVVDPSDYQPREERK